MSQMEMDALVGKTIGELREAGYDDSESGTEGDDIVYVMRNGLFEYSCIVDADFDAYEKAQEEWPDGGNDFVIKSVSFHGITSEAIFKRYHTDGSVEEDPDPFEGYAELMTDVQQMIDSVQNGEEVNIDEYFSGLKDKYPNLVEAIDMYLEMYKMGLSQNLCKQQKAVQNAKQLRESGQRIYPMSACVHHSMPGGRSQGRREAPFIAAPKGRVDP